MTMMAFVAKAGHTALRQLHLVSTTAQRSSIARTRSIYSIGGTHGHDGAATGLRRRRRLRDRPSCRSRHDASSGGGEDEAWIPPSHSPVLQDDDDGDEPDLANYTDLNAIDLDVLRQAEREGRLFSIGGGAGNNNNNAAHTTNAAVNSNPGLLEEDVDPSTDKELRDALQRMMHEAEGDDNDDDVEEEEMDEEMKAYLEEMGALDDDEEDEDDEDFDVDVNSEEYKRTMEEMDKSLIMLEGSNDELGDLNEETIDRLLLQHQQKIEQEQEQQKVKQEEQLLEQEQQQQSSGDGNTPLPDWQRPESQRKKKKNLGHGRLHPAATIDTSPDKQHTLLSSAEIVDCLRALGGADVELIDSRHTRDKLQLDGGMVLATGRNDAHVRTLADTLVKALKGRALAETRGVVAARLGAEGADGWISVDAGNHIVHVLDDVTRASLDLESLWRDDGGGGNVDPARTLDHHDDDAVEDYVRDHPVPDRYAATFFKETEYGRQTGQDHEGGDNDDDELHRYKFKAWEADMKKREKQDKLKKKRDKGRKKGRF